MSRPPWARLDNASNIFLAARSEVDTKVFRISTELDHEVDPGLLQAALDETFDRYPLYRSVLRSGVFWYYLQESGLRPRVEREIRPPCSPIYRADRRTLLFRVMHHRRRIILETFHALSDGTGALWFISDLTAAYLRLRSGAPAAEDRAPVLELPADHGGPDRIVHELSSDAFRHHFQHRWNRVDAAADAGADAGARAGAGAANASSVPTGRRHGGLGRALHATAGRVHRVRGTRTPDNRTRLVELTMPASEALALARAEGVSLTMYLTALFFESIRLASGGLGRSSTLAASVPVNLRQFFPSTSARNFFATVRVEHRYGEGEDDDSVGAVSRALEAQFRPKASPEALERKLRKLIRFERMMVLRIVPRVLKDVLLGLINRGNNRGLTVAVSNLGRVTLPEPAESRVGRMLFHVSAVRPQFCAMSHAGMLTISFTSPFVETDHIREFARLLTARGVDVSVAAIRATEAELAEADLAEAG